MKKYFVIETPEQLKALSDPLRIQIIVMLIKEELTGKQIGELLGHSASRIHYHLKELEAHGFVSVNRTEEKNGIIQKFYRATALDFVVSEELLPHIQEDTMVGQEIIINHLRQSTSRVYKAPEESFRLFANQEAKPPLLSVAGEFKLPRPVIHEWLKKYEELRQELNQLEKEYANKIASQEAEDLNEIFYMLNIGFMTNEQLFISDDQILPEEYEKVTPIVVKKRTREKKG
ncbi:ArsR/SmtB family transcription factor [Brevibacillus ginsengisoli]|uniref:ArsR/SmtB family transcription factor n=1 Tax=Brevibacillus ginsengisoli TaxID=363854 RepID=UPI003CF4E917